MKKNDKPANLRPTIEGISRYAILEVKGEIEVWNISKSRRKSGYKDEKGKQKIFTMIDDEGKRFKAGEGVLRFLLYHPEVSLDALRSQRRKKKFPFSVDGLPGHSPHTSYSRQWSLFKNLDDVMNTVLAMKSFSEGSPEMLLTQMKDFRVPAVTLINRQKGWPLAEIWNAVEEGEDIFIDKILNCNFREIKPLYVRYCISLREAVYNKRKQCPGSFDRALMDKVALVSNN